MKIKTKKRLNLPQLIEWGFDNPELVEGKIYNIDDQETPFDPYVVFPENRMGVRVPYVIEHDDTFTVTVEEEITLTTSLPNMLHIWKTEILGTEIREVENKSIASQYTVCSTEFWLKQDDEMTLIWRDGKLVE